MGCFLEKARERINKALELDATVMERTPDKAEVWLLYAKAFAETDPKRAIDAFRKAYSTNPAIINKVAPDWQLYDLLAQFDF